MRSLRAARQPERSEAKTRKRENELSGARFARQRGLLSRSLFAFSRFRVSDFIAVRPGIRLDLAHVLRLIAGLALRAEAVLIRLQCSVADHRRTACMRRSRWPRAAVRRGASPSELLARRTPRRASVRSRTAAARRCARVALVEEVGADAGGRRDRRRTRSPRSRRTVGAVAQRRRGRRACASARCRSRVRRVAAASRRGRSRAHRRPRARRPARWRTRAASNAPPPPRSGKPMRTSRSRVAR